MTQNEKPKSGNMQYAINLGLAGFAGTVGFVTILIVGGALLLGLFLDNQFHTRPLFTILVLLGSVPITIFIMFRLALGAIARMKPASPANKEDKTGE